MITRPRAEALSQITGWTYQDYVRFSELVQERFGLNFPEKRMTDLEHGVRQAFAASTCSDWQEYYRLLLDETKGELERERLVNALTVGETHFFRNAAQFDALYSHILPQLIERRRPLRTLRIWSAGCASGEEPYSLAMMLRELIPDIDSWAITLLGTDINTEALARARKAIHSNWAFRETRAKLWRSRYFYPHGSTRYALIPPIRQMVTFAQLNLAEDAYPSYETNTMYMDLILCRNVTIYFPEAVTQRIVDRFYDALVDGGWLVVGHSEHSLVTYRRFQTHNFPGAILYQRTGTPTTVAPEWLSLARTPRNASAQPVFPDPTLSPFSFEPPAAPSKTTSPVPAAGRARTTPAMPEPDPDPASHTTPDPTEKARELLEYGHSEQARDLLLQATHHNGQDAAYCVLLGRAYANLGEWNQAQRWCDQAIASDKLALDAYYTLALVQQHRGDVEDAIQAMKKVIYIDRTHILGHFGLADLYHNRSQLPQALKALDNARRLLSLHDPQEMLPNSGGITAGRLQETVMRQQQQWQAEAQSLERKNHKSERIK